MLIHSSPREHRSFSTSLPLKIIFTCDLEEKLTFMKLKFNSACMKPALFSFSLPPTHCTHTCACTHIHTQTLRSLKTQSDRINKWNIKVGESEQPLLLGRSKSEDLTWSCGHCFDRCYINISDTVWLFYYFFKNYILPGLLLQYGKVWNGILIFSRSE